ncbi:MAG: FAD-dependent oxidoreductase [Silicimonas sp.]|nr:FAD-dependent oxidoreductase [Silicimonas sp.]
MENIVIVGAGQAGATLAETLRTKGYEGALTLVGAEPVPPYERPPLSKGYLLGDVAEERLYLRPASVYEEKGIALRLGQPVEAIDTGARVVRLGGEDLPYDALALTTGSVPNRLPAAIGGDLDGLYTVRSLADIDRMAPLFKEGARVLVVGGGYIGLEAAAVAAKLGLNVVLVEMAERILGRVAAAETADVVRETHRAHGVDLREGVGLTRLTGAGHVAGAELSDGSTLEVDFVIVGTGIRPGDDLAQAAGLKCENGIVVDGFGQTSAPGVWAAGDCAAFPYQGGMLRLESVQNAIDQAATVAGNILGEGKAYHPFPWFWSDQYDMKLQIAGLSTGYDRVVVRETAAGRSHWYFAGETFLAVDAINAPRDYMIGKRLLEAGKGIDPAVAGDPEADLKALLRA